MTTTFLPLLIAAEVLYGAACGLLGSRPDAPLWLRWPHPIWQFIRNGGPASKPLLRPDYDKISRLERELGLVPVAPERPIRLGPTVCLTKNCDGDMEELRTWSGVLMRRIHRCG